MMGLMTLLKKEDTQDLSPLSAGDTTGRQSSYLLFTYCYFGDRFTEPQFFFTGQLWWQTKNKA